MDEYYEEMKQELQTKYKEYTRFATDDIDRYAAAYAFWFKEKIEHETKSKSNDEFDNKDLKRITTKKDWIKWIFIANALQETEDIIMNKFNDDTIKEVEFRVGKLLDIQN